MDSIGRALIGVGLVAALLGVVLLFAPSVPLLGKLPGDIRIERPGLRLYVPVTSCLVVSGSLSAIVWLVSKLR